MTARIAGFVTRADAGLEPPRSVSHRIWPERGGVALHWGGPAQRLRSHAACIQRWNEWQRYHRNTRGWTDIAYTGGYCDHGYAFAGRGAGVRTAANGTNQANGEFYAVVWLGGEGETPTREALDAAEWWVRELRAHGGAATGVGPHSSFKPTGCPGGVLRGHAGRINHHPILGAAPAVPNEEEAMTVPTGWIGRGRDRNPVALVFSDGHKISVARSDTDAAARALGEAFGVSFNEDSVAISPDEAYDEIPPVT